MVVSGAEWEQRALDFLRAQGLTVLDRNFSAKTGELDLIMLDRGRVVFVEVRKRSWSRFASAAGSVDRAKQRRLQRTAAQYLQRHPALANRPCRFDVVAFDINRHSADDKPQWLRGVLNGF